VLGTIDPPRIRCPRCGARYAVADDTADLPACPRCGTPDTWEARQPAAFRALIAAIEACTSRPELAMLGRRLYAAKLSRGQAGVAWTRYRIPQCPKTPPPLRLRGGCAFYLLCPLRHG
jgi:hypothetical protein